MKRKFCLFLSIIFTACSVNAFAGDGIGIELNGSSVDGVAGVIADGYTLLEAESAAKLVGGTVAYDDGKSVTISVGSSSLDFAVVDGRVTLRSVAESFGYDIFWDGENKKVNIVEAEKQFEGMADGELREAALIADGYAGILNGYTDKMNKEQSDEFTKACDEIATVLKILDSGSYTEAEITEGSKAIDDAAAEMIVLAQELGVSLENVQSDDSGEKQYEGMADRELKDDALIADGYAGILNGYTDKMNKEQADEFTKACDKVATVLKILDSGSYTEAEITEGANAVSEATDVMTELAQELGVGLEDEQSESSTSTQYEGMADRELKDYALAADGYAGILNGYTAKMNKEQSDKFTKACDKVATVLKILDSGSYTEAEITEGVKAVDEATDVMTKLAQELGVSLE